MAREFKGDCVGVRLSERGGATDRHILVELLIEDDEHWNESGFSISSHWIDETIEMLEAARTYMKTQDPDIVDIGGGPRQFGFKFK